MTTTVDTRHTKLVNLADHLLNTDWDSLNIRKLIIQDHNLDVLDYFKTEGEYNHKNIHLLVANRFQKIDSDIFLPKLEWVEVQIARKKNSLPDAFKLSYLCQTTCEFCGQVEGFSKYYFQGWAWPTNYMHYLVEHKVEPSAAFMVFINTTYDKYCKNK